MKLYTKSGDRGETGLYGGQRVGKDDPRIAAYGQVDELNAAVGLAVSACCDDVWVGQFRQLQDRLFVLGAELADPDRRMKTPTISQADITSLEESIDAATAETPALKHFILPGGCELAARLHLARAICRRAERAVVYLAGREQVGEAVIPFLNRLSDLLFAWARLANHRSGTTEVPWRPGLG
jgi:cob(I)alamin adenosyltransferase